MYRTVQCIYFHSGSESDLETQRLDWEILDMI